MTNPFGAPEIHVQEVADRLARGDDFILMDVREKNELQHANLGESATWVPLSVLAAQREQALPETFSDKEREIVVFCHTGVRSAQVTAWLRAQGWKNVWSMAGGIEAYALMIDPSIGRY